jgi:hypothetical protein
MKSAKEIYKMKNNREKSIKSLVFWKDRSRNYDGKHKLPIWGFKKSILLYKLEILTW